MAKKQAVWGIDIGQCALKAIRCRREGNSIVADKFDFIEYPKILSQAGEEQVELVQEALEQFVSRNELRGDSVAISVPGQAGLSRFFKPPPVEAKKLPDIVKYEVKQQIPFPIEDVIWDWQRMGGTVVDDVTVDAEVGLFAMKRDAVFRALQPFTEQKIEVDLVQLAPVASYNVVCHDLLNEIDEDDYDPDNPPESVVVLAIGTETTDLIVTNGAKLWLRNIPIGGNHFTKQLARELKLTYAKAELLKRNARQAEDPKTVFQAMRPVFNDMVTEIQRSLTFFQSMEKNATINRIALFGNAAKLPGLRQFLNKQLNLDIVKVSKFENLEGDVVQQSSFEDNLLSMAPAYGLCIQGLKQARLTTNLLPQEFVTERMIRAKKPWTVASVALLGLAFMLAWIFASSAWYKVNVDKYARNGVGWSEVGSQVDRNASQSSNFKKQDQEKFDQLAQINDINAQLIGSAYNKASWVELIAAVQQCLPRDERITGDEVNPMEIPFEDRDDIFVDFVETRYFGDLSEWYDKTKPVYDQQFVEDGFDEVYRLLAEKNAEQTNTVNEQETMASASTDTSYMDILMGKEPVKTVDEEEVSTSELAGPGYVIEIKAHHFHNSQDALREKMLGRAFVLKTLVKNMIDNEILLPGADDEIEGGGMYKLADMGIFYPTLVNVSLKPQPYVLKFSRLGVPGADGDQPEDQAGEGQGDQQVDGEDDVNIGTANLLPMTVRVKRYDFVVQFAWKPRAPFERYQVRKRRLKEEANSEPIGDPETGEGSGQQ